ncbi:hypothetical protein J1N35_017809 [Gossypium stocksii]|uniref:Uncharacterized protein n=1 Tax=Gossypium stocksii TaxID=47602 RepID=A0A9D3VNR7_9ROSI|nr:hypothetical protein J1N35_017809 [Gossypium stocksii]
MEFNADMLKISRIKLGYLYAKDESYWAQILRIQWFKGGDRNTCFFHVRATSRLKKNKIKGLNDSNGNWMSDTNNICRVAWNYFHNLFKSKASNHDDNYLNYIQKSVTQNVNNMLARQIMDNDILEAFNQMDPCKTPGIYGLSGTCFKENWDMVGKDVLTHCRDILDSNKDISSLNDTMIIFIPKIKDPNDMPNF